MNKILSFLRLEAMTKHSIAASAAQIAGPDTSPQPLPVTTSSDLVTETVKICRQKRKDRRFVEVKATLAPRLGHNLVTSAKIKWLGREDEVQVLGPSVSSSLFANEVAPKLTRCIDLGVIFHEAGNATRTWVETFVVVEQLSVGIELMLGGTMCEKAKVVAGDRICPLRIMRTREEEMTQEEENDREARREAEARMAAEAHAIIEERRQEEERYREAQRQVEAREAAKARELLLKADKRPGEAGDQPK